MTAGSRKVWRVLPLALLLLASVAVILTGGARYLSLDWLLAQRAWLRGLVAADPLRTALTAYGLYVGAVALSIPVSALLATVFGFLFGWAAGAAIAVAAATTGALLVFTVVRVAFAEVVVRRAGPRLARLRAGFERDAFGYVLALRLLPVVPFWVTNLAAPIFGAPLAAFIPATLIGLVPTSLAFATAGSGIEDVVAAHQAAREACLAAAAAASPLLDAAGDAVPCMDALTLRALVTPGLVAALGALGLLAIVSIVLRRRAAADRPA